MMNHVGAEYRADVIARNFLIHSTLVFILFDFGATCSFLYVKYAYLIGLKSVVCDQMIVILPFCAMIPCYCHYPQVPEMIKDIMFPMDLIHFTLMDFDAILGVD